VARISATDVNRDLKLASAINRLDASRAAGQNAFKLRLGEEASLGLETRDPEVRCDD
jgi:hypothetical protein